MHDLSQRKTKSNLQKWAIEIANLGSFSAPLGVSNIAGIPVPFLVIGNKADIAPNDGGKGSSSNLVDAARQWVEKQGLLPPSEELPLTESFPGSGGLVAVSTISFFLFTGSYSNTSSVLHLSSNLIFFCYKLNECLFNMHAQVAKEGRLDKEAVNKFFLNVYILLAVAFC